MIDASFRDTCLHRQVAQTRRVEAAAAKEHRRLIHDSFTLILGAWWPPKSFRRYSAHACCVPSARTQLLSLLAIGQTTQSKHLGCFIAILPSLVLGLTTQHKSITIHIPTGWPESNCS